MSKKVALCAGHGGSGSTPGKRTPAGEYEWNFNDKVIRAGIAVLEASGVEVLRTDDASGKTDVPLRTRTNRANNWGADAYWSAHHNAFQGRWGTHTGVDTFTQNGSHPQSERLASIVHPKLVRASGLRDRGIKKMNLHITRETRMPAILTEGGFMDSSIDIKKLRDDSYLKAQGEAIAEGILEFLGIKVSSGSPAPSTPSTGSQQSGSTGKGNMTTTSIVTYLNSIGENSSYNHRAKLAAQHGISNYRGTAAQNTQLLAILRGGGSKPAPKPSTPSKQGNMTTGSIVTYLNSIGVNSSYNNRAKLASQHGISNYRGTAAQNTQLLNILRSGASDGSASKSIDQMAREIIRGDHGTGHDNRRRSLGISQSQYNKVRARVNQLA